MLFVVLLVLYFSSIFGKENEFTTFKDSLHNEFGIMDSENVPCFNLRFRAKLYNLNLNGSDIASEIADLTAESTSLSGYCATPKDKKKESKLVGVWTVGKRKKRLEFQFQEAFVRTLGQSIDELRWQLYQVAYTERFNGRSITFRSSNETIVVSAPVRQKFLCKDSLNISLFHPEYQNFVLELMPEIDMQPMNTGAGFGSNIYVCERTRKRTLSESFQSKMTVFSGVILGLSSVGTMTGYSVWRNLNPSRRELYNNI